MQIPEMEIKFHFISNLELLVPPSSEDQKSSLKAVATYAGNITFFKLHKNSHTASGPPVLRSWIDIDSTLLAGMVPAVFSSTHWNHIKFVRHYYFRQGQIILLDDSAVGRIQTSRRFEDLYPKDASLANSVSPAGTNLQYS